MRPIKLKNIAFILTYVVFVFLLFETGLRIFLVKKFTIPFLNPENIIYNYYPELKEVKDSTTSKEDGVFDILLLAGSVLNNEFGNIESELLRQLKDQTNKEIRVHNLAVKAHSSLDSKIKYELLKEKHFDLVIFYHGINEVRANNCPDSIFKPDYSHYSWYKDVYNILNHKEIRFTVIPYIIDYLTIKFKKKFGIEEYVPAHSPIIREWVEYGKNIKTTQSFKKNVLDIIHIAKSHKVPLLILTFAYYIPDAYTYEKFKNKELDYTYSYNRSFSIEFWGIPAYVKAGIEAHNGVIRDIADNYSYYDQLYYIDLDYLINKNKENFYDICHLTSIGSKEFVSNLTPIIKSLF